MANSTLKNSSEETVNKVVDRAKEVSPELVDRAKDASAELLKRGEQYLDRGRELAGEYSEDAVAYVRRFPVQSVLVGFGVGLLLGAILTPKRFI